MSWKGGCRTCDQDRLAQELLAERDQLWRDRIREAVDSWDGDALVTKFHARSLVDHIIKTAEGS